MDAAAEHLAWEANFYESKLIQDTTVESKSPKANNVFGDVAFLGSTRDFGTQYLYLRFDYDKLSDIKTTDIDLFLLDLQGKGLSTSLQAKCKSLLSWIFNKAISDNHLTKNPVEFETKYFVQKELDIRGSRNANPSDFRAVQRYFDKNNVPMERFISGIATPETAKEAMEKWAADPAQVFRLLVKF